ncbi:nuclease Le1 [Hysterangium stoloniferum]|nr:nuclease Le1 [Hysterangium stoloniferum]
MKFAISLVVLSTLARGVLGWGALGHETVGFVAMEFLAPKALTFVQSTLLKNFSGTLGGPAATWADTVRSTTAFKWSAPFHFIDAEDSPLTGSCSVVETRDCGTGGCILSAIANYTKRVTEVSLTKEQKLEALLFLGTFSASFRFFFGDIGQPLHVEALEVGGNDIPAICSGTKTNLHACVKQLQPDTGMVVKNIDDNHNGTSAGYAADLVTEIKSGKFKTLTSSWIECSSTNETLATGLVERSSLSTRVVKPLACPLVWAQETNAFDCTNVFGFTTGQDLCTTSYFTQAVPVIDLQLAKQGFRLAAWLNVLFDGATNL